MEFITAFSVICLAIGVAMIVIPAGLWWNEWAHHSLHSYIWPLWISGGIFCIAIGLEIASIMHVVPS